MSEIKNIPGLFDIELCGQTRTMKCNFGAIEQLETRVLRKSLGETLQDAMEGKIFLTDIVAVIQVGLSANNDTRLRREEIGEDIVKQGLAVFVPVFLNYLTYAITGGKESKDKGTGEG